MYERFTDHARSTLKAASEEAEQLQHHELTAEHLLLGVLHDTEGAAATVLKNLNLDMPRVRRELESVLGSGPQATTAAESPPMYASASVIESAIEEARNLNHMYVGTEHLLLGVLVSSDSAAAQILNRAGVSLEAVRQEVRKLIGEGFSG